MTEAARRAKRSIRWPSTRAAIAVCDVGLPDRNGLWLAGQMRRQFPHTALVITTGFGITALPSNLDADAIGYLPKALHEAAAAAHARLGLEWRHEQTERACCGGARLIRASAVIP